MIVTQIDHHFGKLQNFQQMAAAIKMYHVYIYAPAFQHYKIW